MGFLDAALDRRSYRVTTTNPMNPAYWLVTAFGGDATSSGIRVDPEKALAFSAIYAACRNQADDIGGLPLPIYRGLTPEKRERDYQHAAHALLNRAANPEMTAIDFRGAIQGHAALRGNGYAEIEWSQTMRPLALWPLRPDRMRLVRNGVNATIDGAPDGQLAYAYTLPSGQIKIFAPDLIFHLRGYSPDGLQGWSVVRLAREGIALALAAQEYLGKFYAQDGRPGVVLKHPYALSPKAKENIRDSWEQAHEGLSNAHRIAILEEGMDIASIPMTFDDAQFMESRKFEVTEVARWFRQPPHKLMDFERATYSNIEQSSLDYIIDGVRPGCIRWEQELARSSIVTQPWFAEHNVDALLRGDSQARAIYYHNLRQDGAITGNDIRDKENLPRSDDPAADQLLIPLNMMPASSFGDDGMTAQQRYQALSQLTLAGYKPEAACAVLGIDPIDHTGYIPRIVDQNLNILTGKPADPNSPQAGGDSGS